MNNNTFQFTRFARYFHKIWVEQWRNNLMRTIILLAFCLLSVFLIAATSYRYWFLNDTRMPTEDEALDGEALFFTFLFVVSGCIAASTFMANLGSKSQRISSLTLPVTGFEMFTARWLMSSLMFIITFLGCFYTADTLRLAVFSMFFPDSSLALLNIFKLGEFTIEWYYLLLIYFTTSSVYILGAVFFIQQAFLKTSVALCILFVVYLTGVAVLNFGISFSYYESAVVPLAVGELLFSCCALGLAYVRFKELNVINRL